MKIKFTGIYMIISPTAKVYIGQSTDLHKRKMTYKRGCDKTQSRIYNSIVKYGFDAHIFEVIEFCSVEKLNELERYWQDQYEVLGVYGLNLKLTQTDDKNGQHSEITKQKIGLKQKNKIVSSETKIKLKESHLGQKAWNKGLVMSDEARKNMSNAKKNLSEQARKNLSDAKKKYYQNKRLENECR